MESYKNFKENLMHIADIKIESIEESKEDSEKFSIAMFTDIFLPKEAIKYRKDFLPKDVFFAFLFNGFDEIYLTVERLNDLENYISNFPKTKSSLSKINYLRFLIENHFNEVYILKERLVSYLKKIERSYQKDHKQGLIKNKCQQLIDKIEESFQNIQRHRHIHIHRSRYSDKDISRLEALSINEELINKSKNILPSFIIPNFNNEFKKARSKWKEIIMQNNKEIKKVLNYCFKEVNIIIFTKDGEISYPKKSNFITKKMK